MKKITLTLTFIVLILALTACGSNAAVPQAANNNSAAANNDSATAGNSTGSNVAPQFTLAPEITLMLGTVKLDETNVAIDAEQASELLPLWKALRSLSESDTAAQAEIDALIAQIEDTMIPEQINAIEAMQLSMQDMASVAEALGIEAGNFGGRSGEITPEMQATREAARASGEVPGGGPGGGMGLGPGGGMGGAEMDPAARATAMAERGGTRGAGLGLNTSLLDAIIEFLEAKTAQ